MSDKLIGEVMDGFEIERVLGKGGMGVVYKAHESTLQRIVAIKVLPHHLSENESFIARFYREARAVASLNHPNVVTVHRVGESHDCHYIAMELIKGHELYDLLKEQGPLDITDALEYIRQTASALQAAHAIGILHRDIKPQNIMIDEHNRVKVMDFGIAKILSPEADAPSLTMDGTLLGTPTHMPPEQCEGKAVDQRGDLYSLGIVLYQALTAQLPFKGDTPLAIIQKILNDPLPDIREVRSDVPEAVIHIVEKACSKDPEERYENAKAFEKDLATCLKALEKGGEIDETLVKARSPGKLKTKKTNTGLIAVILASLVLIGGVFFFLRSAPDETPKTSTLKPLITPTTPNTISTEKPIAPPATPIPIPTPTPIPNSPPKASITMPSSSSMQGNPFVIQFNASDPDDDALDMAYRLKESDFWQVVRTPKITRIDFPVGKHTLQFRVIDSRGEQVFTEKSFTISPRPTPTPAPIVIATPIPPAITINPAGEIAMLDGENGGSIMALKISPDGKTLASGSSRGKLKLWDAQSHTLIKELEGHFVAIDTLAFSKDSKRMISGDKKAEVMLWDIETGDIISRFQGHHSAILTAAFAPDGKNGVSADNAGNLFLWELASGEIIQRTNMGKITCVDFATNEPLAISGSQDQALLVWDYVTGQKIKTLSGGLYRTTMAVAFSANGQTILSGGQDKVLRIWNLKSGQVTQAMEGHDGWIQALSFIPGENYILSGGRDNSVRVWDSMKGKEHHKFNKHTRSVLSLNAHSGKLISSGSLDQSVRLWKIR